MTMMLLIKFYFQKTELNEDIIRMASLLLSHTHHTHSDRSIMLVITLTLRIEIFALINCWISISISIVILYGVSFGLNFFFHFVSSSFSSFFYFDFRSLSCISRFLSLCVSWDTFFNRISWQLKHKRAHIHHWCTLYSSQLSNKSWILLSVYGFVFISFNRMPFLLQSKIKLIDMVSNKCFQTDRTMTQPIKTILWNDRDVSLSGFYHSGIMYIAVAWIFN